MLMSRLKIIVAEDSEVQRLYLCGLINKLGYEAIPAEDGQVALDLVVETGAQIVISDLQMPHLDGIGLTEKIRKLDLDHYVYLIMVTSDDDFEVRKHALDSGADDFITKGGSTETLRARIRAATRLINHARELAERTRVLKDSNDRIQQDLQAAASAQRQLLPDLQEDIMGFRIASAFVPSSIVSGDMFGCFELTEHKLGFYTVDVSGHGVHASLLSVAIGHLVTPEYFRTKALNSDGAANPAALIEGLNDRFSTSDNDDYFTMFCGVIDTSTGRLDFCQAGYPSPFYVNGCGIAQAIGDGGFPVGMLSGVTYENRQHHIDVDGALFICSDAASEAEDLTGAPFGTARVQRIAQTLPPVGVGNIPDTLIRALHDWRSGSPLEDDLTVVALQRTNPNDTYIHA